MSDIKPLLLLKDASLPLELCIHDLDDPFYRNQIRFIEQKRDEASRGYVEVINSCPHCGYGVEQPPGTFALEINPCYIWHFSVLGDSDDGSDPLWLEIMEEDQDWTQEEIRIYQCCHCQKWEIDNDC